MTGIVTRSPIVFPAGSTRAEPVPIEAAEELEEAPATDEVNDGEELEGELPGEPGLSPA